MFLSPGTRATIFCSKRYSPRSATSSQQGVQADEMSTKISPLPNPAGRRPHPPAGAADLGPSSSSEDTWLETERRTVRSPIWRTRRTTTRVRTPSHGRPAQAPRSRVHSFVDLHGSYSVRVFVPAEQSGYLAAEHDRAHYRRSRDRLKQVDRSKPAYPPVGATASIEASRASAAVRTSVRRESLESPSPKQKQAKSSPETELLPISSTKDQSRPAVTGKETAESVPVIRDKASRNSAAPRAPTQTGPYPAENPEVAHRHGGQRRSTQFG